MPTGVNEAPSFAFFVQDEGGWWTFKGIHVDKEEGLRLIETHKRHPHCTGLLAVELPSCKKIYEWAAPTDTGATR